MLKLILHWWGTLNIMLQTKINYIKAYDADGNLYLLNAIAEPEWSVIILGINERTDENGNVSYKDLEEAISMNASLKTETTTYREVLKRINVLNLEES